MDFRARLAQQLGELLLANLEMAERLAQIEQQKQKPPEQPKQEWGHQMRREDPMSEGT